MALLQKYHDYIDKSGQLVIPESVQVVENLYVDQPQDLDMASNDDNIGGS